MKKAKASETEKRWDIYRTIPQKDWKAMSGRHPKTLKSQAKLYGIPFGNAVVCLPDVVEAFHNFLADHAKLLRAYNGEGDDAISSVEADRRYKIARAELHEIQLQRTREELIPIDEAAEREDGIVKFFCGVMDRAGAELSGKIAGRKPSEVKTIVTEYFDGIRRAATTEKPS